MKKNPITYGLQFSVLYPGEGCLPVNPYTKQGYTIKPYYYATTFGRILSNYGGRWLELKQQTYNKKEYLYVMMPTEEGETIHVSIHRLILAAFCPVYCMYSLHVDHINGNKTDNRLWNLRWATDKENTDFAYDLGLIFSVTDTMIKEVHRLVDEEKSDVEIGKIVGLSDVTVEHIRVGQPPYDEALNRLGLKPKKKREASILDDDDYIKIMQMFYDGATDAEVYNLYKDKVKLSTIIFIRSGNSIYKSVLERLNLKPVFRVTTEITDEMILELMDMAKQGIPDKIISEKLNLAISTVGFIRTGYSKYGSRLQELGLKPINLPSKQSTITDNDIILIINLAKEGKSDIEISNYIGKCSPRTIKRVRLGEDNYGERLKQLNLLPKKI